MAVFLLAMIGAQPVAAAQQSAPQQSAPQESTASVAAAADVDGFTAGNAAIASVDLAGTWSFTPAGRSTTSIKVPGGGWYKQGFTDVNEAVYSRTVVIPDSGQPQSTWIEFGAVNHQATLSVDGRVVATQTTAFTPSNFDISSYAAPGTTHTISVHVKGRGALKAADGKYLVPVAADWSEAIPQGIFRSAYLRAYPAVRVSDAFVRTSVADRTISYDVSVTNSSAATRTVTLTGSLASDGAGSFSYPQLPQRTVTVAARSTAKVTVGPVAWNLGTTSYWWPNVPYRPGYRAQLHRLAIHAATDDGRTSDATYRFGFRESTQNGEYYYLNGVRVNFRGDSLQGADYDRVNNGGKGDAYDTLPGFLPPSPGNGGWPQAVDNYQRLNYNVVRIHMEPASPYMLDVADEMGLMIIDETAIRSGAQNFVAGRDNMVAHARALTLRDRNHPAVIRWSQINEPSFNNNDSQQFEQDLYAAMNGNDGTRPISIDAAPGADSASRYPAMNYPNFAIFAHYLDGTGRYGEALNRVPGRPDGEGEYIWPACSTKQGFTWFATATLAKRGKDASDLRPYTLLSAWAGVVPGVRTTDFTTEEGSRPVYGADNLTDPWSNSQIQRVQAAFNPVAAVDLPYWSASGASDSNGTFPLPQAVPSYARNATVTRNITVFNDDLTDTSVNFTWTARLDDPTGAVIASGNTNLTIPLGSRVTQPVTFTTPASGSRVYLVLTTTKSGTTTFTDAVEYFNLGSGSGPVSGATYRIVNRNSGKPLAVAGNSSADGAKAVQQSGSAAWTVTSGQDGAYTLRYTPTGKALDVNASSTTQGLQLQQWTANGGSNQLWYLRPTGDGYYTIVSYSSGLLADVYGASTSDGAQVVQWAATGGTNQQWQLVPS
ncbi:RICIN domain-containing protein [Streptosporangium sp. NPDC023615]|uniref:RICIN domain-containing protein n=1 Tax=Streptosporangium sp. NPDC023615 TaxID=3154794 RepID=UPI00342BCBC3